MKDQIGPAMDEPAQQGGMGRFLRAQIGSSLGLSPFDRKNQMVLAALAVLLWLISGFYIVQPSEQGVVLRFGHWIKTQGPGLHYHLPYPIDKILLPKVTTITENDFTNQEMLVDGG